MRMLLLAALLSLPVAVPQDHSGEMQDLLPARSLQVRQSLQ